MTTPQLDGFDAFQKRRRLFLDEWQVGVHPLDEDKRNIAQGAVDIAQTALRAGMMLNGGALVLIPGYLAFARGPIDDHMHAAIVCAVIAFVLGLLLSWLATVLGYFTMVSQGRERWQTREAVTTQLQEIYRPSFAIKEPEIIKQEAAKGNGAESDHGAAALKEGKAAERFRVGAIVASLLSFGAFTIGCVIGISVVS